MSAPAAEPVLDERFTGWRRPEGYTIESVGFCKGCRAAISWARTPTGHLAPLDPSGVNHFATCPKAETFRRRAR